MSSRPPAQVLLFLRLRGRILRNTLDGLVRQSSVRLVSMVLCSLLIWGFVYAVSYEGFDFIRRRENVPAFGNIVGVLFDFLFVALAVMLVFSSGLILYSSLFSSPEARFLLATPARADQVFAYKYQGAIAFSSWAFVLLGTPVLLAYGFVYGVSWAFYTLLPLFFVGFVLLPGSLGALACLVIVNLVPKRRRQVLAGLLLGLIVAIGIYGYRASKTTRAVGDNREMVNQFLGKLNFSRGPLVPTHWMTRGLQLSGQGALLATPRGEPGAVYYLAMIWSNGLFFYVLTSWAASRLYRRGFNRVATGGSLRKRYGGVWLDNLLAATMGFLDRQTRLLMVKDFRTFRRDPAQWAQVAIITGLMALYSANIRRLMISEEIDWVYQNGLSLLNVATTGLLLCIYTGRFIFPMLSLEGRKFWILGLLPFRRERLLWGKFAFAATGALIIAEGLVLLSDFMLGLPWTARVIHVLTVGVLAVGLSGLSVGLGACLPTFKETDPSKIAAGFGGTLNLVAGLFYLLFIIGTMSLPWHIRAALGQGAEGFSGADLAVLGVTVVAGIAGVGVAWLALKAGARALERMEF